MTVKPNHLREDVEDQFEIEGLPLMTVNRAKDYRKPCEKCELAECRCLGWKAFDVVN